MKLPKNCLTLDVLSYIVSFPQTIDFKKDTHYSKVKITVTTLLRRKMRRLWDRFSTLEGQQAPQKYVNHISLYVSTTCTTTATVPQ